MSTFIHHGLISMCDIVQRITRQFCFRTQTSDTVSCHRNCEVIKSGIVPNNPELLTVRKNFRVVPKVSDTRYTIRPWLEQKLVVSGYRRLVPPHFTKTGGRVYTWRKPHWVPYCQRYVELSYRDVTSKRRSRGNGKILLFSPNFPSFRISLLRRQDTKRLVSLSTMKHSDER